MHKTFCDRDGRECEARTGYLHMTVVHRTNRDEVVAEDDYRPVDLCGPCIDALIAFFGPVLSAAPRKTGDDPEMAMAAEARPVRAPLAP